MAIQPFLYYKHHGVLTDAIAHSQYVDHFDLAANTAQTVTRPTGAVVVIMSCTADFFVDWHGAAAVVPSGDKTDGAGVELNPSVREIGDLTNFSVITATEGADLTLAWYGK